MLMRGYNLRLLLALVLLLAGAARQLAKERRPSVLRPGARLYAYVGNTGDGTVTAVNLVTLRTVATIAVGPAPSGLRAHPTRAEVWGVSTTGGYAWVIDTAKGELAARVPVGEGAFALDFSPDGRRAYVAASASGNVVAIDCATRQVAATARPGRQPWIVRVAPDGRSLLVTLHGEHRVAQLDATTLRELSSIVVASRPEQIFIEGRGEKAFVSAAGSRQVSVVDLQQRALVTNLPLNARATDLIGAQDGKILVPLPEANALTILDSWRNEVEETRILGSAPTQGVATSDGALVYVTDTTANQVRPFYLPFRQARKPIAVGQRPVTARLTEDDALLLVVNEGSEDLAVISTRAQTPILLTLIALGRQPRDLAIKLF
jgi:YVTN family beta-propeller protein